MKCTNTTLTAMLCIHNIDEQKRCGEGGMRSGREVTTTTTAKMNTQDAAEKERQRLSEEYNKH